MHKELMDIDTKRELFEHYTDKELWDDEHISKNMLEFHLNGDIDPASRRKEFMEKSTSWIASRFCLGSGVRVADFGCGPGLYASAFSALGAEVTGIDFSRRSIAYAMQSAEEKGQDIDYVNMNYLDYVSRERFDLITLIF